MNKYELEEKQNNGVYEKKMVDIKGYAG